MKKSVNCPSCGAPVEFTSGASVYAVCRYCRSMIVRHDVDVEVIGKMAILLDDPTPLQITTTGRMDRVSFSLAGRLRQKWRDGAWNEWFAVFDDGRHGWLAEAQGFYMISFEADLDIKAPLVEQLLPDHTLRIGKKDYRVDDIKRVTCAGSEGELPFPAPVGRKSVSIDLSAGESDFASLDYSDEGVAFYTGRYFEFDELRFANLKDLDGW